MTAPVTTTDAQVQYMTTNASISLSATDAPGVPNATTSGVASTHWRLDGGGWNTGTTATTVVEGNHTLEYYSTDVAGNDEAVKSVDFAVVSHVVPTSILLPSANPTSTPYGKSVTFSGISTDNDAPFEYSWTSDRDGFLSNQSSFTTSTLSPGTHTITFRAKCALGIWSFPLTTTVTVTKLAPALTVKLPTAVPYTGAYVGATLSGPLGTVKGKSLQLWDSARNATTTVPVSSTGSYSIKLAPANKTTYRLSYAGDTIYNPDLQDVHPHAAGPPLHPQGVAPLLDLHGHDLHLAEALLEGGARLRLPLQHLDAEVVDHGVQVRVRDRLRLQQHHDADGCQGQLAQRHVAVPGLRSRRHVPRGDLVVLQPELPLLAKRATRGRHARGPSSREQRQT